MCTRIHLPSPAFACLRLPLRAPPHCLPESRRTYHVPHISNHPFRREVLPADVERGIFSVAYRHPDVRKRPGLLSLVRATPAHLTAHYVTSCPTDLRRSPQRQQGGSDTAQL